MARSFIGQQYVTMATGSGPLQPADPMSLAFWVNMTGFASFAFIAGNLNILDNGYGIAINTSGVLQYRVGNNGGSGLAGSTLSTGIWYHVGLTVISGTLKGWLNGVQDASGATAGFLYNTGNTSKFGVGARQDSSGNTQGLNGNVADVAVWSAGLTVFEMAALAKGVRPPQVRPNALNGYWPLAGLQSPEPDLSSISSSKNNGTLTGPPEAVFGPPLLPATTVLRQRPYPYFTPLPPIYDVAGFAHADW